MGGLKRQRKVDGRGKKKENPKYADRKENRQEKRGLPSMDIPNDGTLVHPRWSNHPPIQFFARLDILFAS